MVTAVQTRTATTLVRSTVAVPTTVTTRSRTTELTTTTATGISTVYQKRQVTVSASAIPTYASACSGAVKYSSACSCLGVTRYTITLSTASTTTLATATALSTSVVVTTVVTGTVTSVTLTTVTRVSTVTPLLVKPKICGAPGGFKTTPPSYYYDFAYVADQASCISL